MIAKTLEPFPTGNPFWHDQFSTGARLRDITVVDPERESEYLNLYIMFGSPRMGQGLYIVNADTGERIGISFEDRCGIQDRSIAECNPPIEPHSDPSRCGICGRKV